MIALRPNQHLHGSEMSWLLAQQESDNKKHQLELVPQKWSARPNQTRNQFQLWLTKQKVVGV